LHRTFFAFSIYAPWGDLQFNHFLVRDEEPLLFHTGLRGMFPEIREAVEKLIPLASLRHISFSHFESDECGALNEWLAVAPQASVVCSQVGSIVCVNDFIGREASGLSDGEVFATGKYRFRYCQTPHLGRTAGTRACSLKRPTRRYCARTCFIRPATLSP
jgi:flavorubredoxin